MSKLSQTYNIDDLAALAKERLPFGLYEFIDRGAEDGVTVRENAESIKRILVKQKVDVSKRDISTTVFGVKQSMPLGLAVTGMAGMISYKGEHSLARASAAAGVPYMIGTSNFAAAAEIKPICGELTWRQIYPAKDRKIMEYRLKGAEELGARVLVITLDSPVVGNREYMARNGWVPAGLNRRNLPQILSAPYWLFGTLLRYIASGSLPEIADMPPGERRFFGGTGSFGYTADDFTWEEIRTIRRRWKDILVLKGISTAEDAKIAVEQCGADGVIVSNHGGRSLDSCVPSMGALPEVVDAVAAKVPVMVDGGFKRGADVLKAIAVGASMVFVGRATMFGLAAGGEAGVAHALAIFRSEINRAMAMFGAKNLSELNREFLLMPK